jgi:hypothetical protein
MTRAARATSDSQGTFLTNGRYLTISWNGHNSTLIACSSNKTAVGYANLDIQPTIV